MEATTAQYRRQRKAATRGGKLCTALSRIVGLTGRGGLCNLRGNRAGWQFAQFATRKAALSRTHTAATLLVWAWCPTTPPLHTRSVQAAAGLERAHFFFFGAGAAAAFFLPFFAILRESWVGKVLK